MASDKNVIIRGGEDENLHTMMEVLEGISARTKELGEVGSDVDELKGAIERLSARCDQLDRELPQGQKVFEAETPVKNVALREFGSQISQAWRIKQFGRAAAGQTSDATAPGGVLVPTITYDKVARIVEEASIIRNIATVVPMSSNTMVMPTRSSGPSVSWLADQQILANKTSVMFENPTLSSKTLMAIDEVSAELDEDSIVALEPFFAQMFAEAVGKEENKQAFNSTTPFTGVSNDTNITSVQMGSNALPSGFSRVSHSDLINLQYTADPKVIHKGTFIMHPDAFKECVGLKDSNGRPIYASAWYGGGPSTGADAGDRPEPQQAAPAVLLGRPAYLTETMPSDGTNNTIFGVYGDFSKFAFGDRKQMTIDWSDQVYYEYGNLALRVRERIAMKTLITGAFARLAV